MITAIFTILMLMVFGKILWFAIKMAWGIAKICIFLVFLPVILIALACLGLIYVALPILLIVGIVSLVKAK